MERKAVGCHAEPCMESNPIDAIVIGYGNDWCGDDGVGPAVANQVAALRLPNVLAMVVHQLTPELAEPISRSRRAVFVDAACEPNSGVKVRRVQVDAASNLMTHANHPGTLLAIAELLYQRSPPAWMVTIEGQEFSPGHGLSESTNLLVEGAVQRVLTLLHAEHSAELSI